MTTRRDVLRMIGLTAAAKIAEPQVESYSRYIEGVAGEFESDAMMTHLRDTYNKPIEWQTIYETPPPLRELRITNDDVDWVEYRQRLDSVPNRLYGSYLNERGEAI